MLPLIFFDIKSFMKRRFEVLVSKGRVTFVDVTAMGPEEGFTSLKEIRDGLEMVLMGVPLKNRLEVLQLYDELCYRYLNNQLLPGDIVIYGDLPEDHSIH